ncbi:MAG: ATP-binding cassette domain-containing protein [Acidimicrobiia bacterium]|nr:ATP-binding cassette domain-containing protein [Acidimicrobiia bacterium]
MNAWREHSHILHEVNLEVAPGEAVAIVGRNGVGKTTLVESILQMGPRIEGVVEYGENRLDQISTSDMAYLGIALVPQGRRLFESLSVQEHLDLARRVADSDRREHIFDMFPILRQRASSPAPSLSGGERSMLAIARALLTEPNLVLMDEPTEGLAPILVAKICDSLIQMKQVGLSILLVEQSLDVALAVSDRLLIMDRGTIVEEFSDHDALELEEISRLIVLGRSG